MDWHEYFISLAKTVAQKSKDDSTKVGALIVGPDHEIRGTGYNGFPRGVIYTSERQQRPAKYMWTAHAEVNAIAHAARVGVACKGCTLYLNWYPTPCADCAKVISGAGISRIIGPNEAFPGNQQEYTNEKWKCSIIICKSANISRFVYNVKERELREII
jgi:dCMP deaminase